MKITLAINTASSPTAIALLTSKKVLAEKSWFSWAQESEKLLPEVLNLLKKAKLNFADLKQIFAITGPGSFSGVRIGITVANTLAYALKISVFGLNLEELKTRSASSQSLLKKKLSFGETVLKLNFKKLLPQEFLKPYYRGKPQVTHPKKPLSPL